VNMALLNAGKINRFQMEIRHVHLDGKVVWIDMTISSLTVEDATHRRHLCMIQDITERKAAEGTIVHLNRVYAMLSGINALIVRVSNRDELFQEACRIAVEEGGFRMSLLCIVDRSAMKIVPVASTGKDEELLTAIKGMLSSSEAAPTTMVARAITEKKAIVSNDSQKDPRIVFGKKYAASGVRSMAILPLIVSDEAVGVLTLYASESEFFHEEEMKLLTQLASDIAFAIDHIDKQERLNYLAYYDALTGLANRTLFLERVARYMRSAVSGGNKLVVFLVDLERFKNINDSLGRPAGDALLRQVAEWLTNNAGGADLLARVGADHFALVLPEVRKDGDVARLVEKTRKAFLAHPFRLNDAVFRISAKVGVAVFPDDGADAETLFKNAEAALKKAKASGERYLFYTQKMTDAVVGKLSLENQLRQAIDNEEFVLHYQPKVNLVSGKVTGAEALIRWNDPHTGLVPPGRFIPILEEIGLIHEVGRWALHQAIKDYLRWRSAGRPVVRIAVNVSALQLHNRGFISEIEQAIAIDTHAADGLELEITESLIMEDVEYNIAVLQAIRAMGVSIAIDDFGTGFSSLSYLAKLPVDTLKIDRSFVIGMTAGQEGLALVSTIISLAHSLKLKVVAEGVETEEQSRLLRSLSCDEMQGFLFSKPVPAEIFETRFLSSSPAG
jgi:diguanylate cyclase (GGDEF)-like protein